MPRGNGTLCPVLEIKLKDISPSYKWKNYYGKKVWTVNAIYVEWVECELVNKTGLMLQLETQIHNYTNQLNLAEKENQEQKHQIQTKLDN